MTVATRLRSKLYPPHLISAVSLRLIRLMHLEPLHLLEARRDLAVVVPLSATKSDLLFEVTTSSELRRTSRLREPWTVDWVRSLPPQAVLWDVGANLGIFSLLAAKEPHVRCVVAIEPFYLNYAHLVGNVIRNGLSDKVAILPIGLGDQTQLLDLNLQSLVAGSALHSFGPIVKMKADRSAQPVGKSSCLSMRADDLAALSGMPFPTHIKIDVDGYETNVLDGAQRILADPRLLGLQIEVMDFGEELLRRKEMIARMESYGLRLVRTFEHASSMPQTADLQFARA